MAAANAIFWTSTGWDGSEEMATRSVQYCVRVPERARMTFFSSDSIKTLIITLQGIQTVFLSEFNIYGNAHKVAMAKIQSAIALDNAFSLALIGLLRLFAAFWVTAEFSYVAIEDIPLGLSRAFAISADSLQMQPFGDVEPLVHLETSKPIDNSGFRPTSWPSRVFCFVYMFIFATFCFLGLIALLMMQGEGIQHFRNRGQGHRHSCCVSHFRGLYLHLLRRPLRLQVDHYPLYRQDMVQGQDGGVVPVVDRLPSFICHRKEENALWEVHHELGGIWR